MQCINRQAGVTLIEVLVVVIVIGVGMLGLSAMQVVSIKQTANAGLQTQAMLLTDDMLERMRANRNALFNGSNLTLAAYGKPAGSAFPTSTVTACNSSPGCSAQQMASSDLFAWSNMVSRVLPTDAATLQNSTFICFDSDASDTNDCDGIGSTILIQIGWLETNPIDGSTTQTYRMVFEP